MNLGSPIELLLLAAFVAAGAYVGEQHIGGTTGAVIGGLAGALARVVLGISIYLLDRWPACSCGNEKEDRFEFAEHAPAKFAWKCRQCGKLYERARRDWVEVVDNGARIPRMRQGFLGTWKPVRKE